MEEGEKGRLAAGYEYASDTIEIIEKVNSGIICLNNLGYITAINDTSLCILNINKDYNIIP